MAHTTRRILIPATPKKVDAVVTALARLAMACSEAGGPDGAILLVPTKAAMKDAPIEQALGSGPAKSLANGSSHALPGGVALTLKTAQTFGWISDPQAVAAIWPDKKTLDKIDGQGDRVPLVVVVASYPGDPDIEAWRKTWSPEIPGEEQGPPDALIEDPVVGKALQMLTDHVNLSTGLAHPADRGAAVELLKLLWAGGHRYRPDAVRAWAMRNGWRPKGADELRDVSEAIACGKNPRVQQRSYWATGILKRLRENQE